jgi:hypothetical protein
MLPRILELRETMTLAQRVREPPLHARRFLISMLRAASSGSTSRCCSAIRLAPAKTRGLAPQCVLSQHLCLTPEWQVLLARTHYCLALFCICQVQGPCRYGPGLFARGHGSVLVLDYGLQLRKPVLRQSDHSLYQLFSQSRARQHYHQKLSSRVFHRFVILSFTMRLKLAEPNIGFGSVQNVPKMRFH